MDESILGHLELRGLCVHTGYILFVFTIRVCGYYGEWDASAS